MKDYAVCELQIANATPLSRKRPHGIGSALSFLAGIVLALTLAALFWGV